MLSENEIVAVVCDYLETRKFTIERRCLSTERGDDIVALSSSDERIFIEAKGEGSAREGSARHGSVFNSGQVFDVVAKAFYRAAVMLQQGSAGERRYAGLALPDTLRFRQRVKAIDQALVRLSMPVFWVQADRSVTVENVFPGLGAVTG